MQDSDISGPGAPPIDDRIAAGTGRTAVRGWGAMAAAVTLLATIMTVGAAAQAPPAPKPAPKAQPKSTRPPVATPAPATVQPQHPAGAPEQLVYVPWSKFCGKGQEADAKQVCVTGRFGRDETGATTVMAMLIDPEGNSTKTLRVMLPLGMQLEQGMTTTVDQSQPMKAPYVICLPGGCMAEYEASGDLIARLKSGQGLVVQGINYLGEEVTYTVPLSGFALSYDGPPMDPKAQEEQQKKLEDELQKRAAEARKKLESQTPPAK
jgi:invasion protein IalB